MYIKKSQALILLFLISIQFASCSNIVIDEIVDGDVISMSANGDAVVVLDFQGKSLVTSKIVVFRRIQGVYQKVVVKDLNVYVGSYQNYNRPRLSDDGLYMYFIHGDTGLVAKGSLMNTSPAQPYVQVMSINNWACQGLRFQCRFALSGDYLAFYSHSSKVLSVASRDSVLLFNNSIECTRYPHYPEFEQFYECTQYRQSTRPQYNPYNCPSTTPQSDNQTQTTIVPCSSSYCTSNGDCGYIYEENGYEFFMAIPEIVSISLSKDGKTVVLRNQLKEYKYCYVLNFHTNQFEFSAIRRDLQPEIFPDPNSNLSFWSRPSGTHNELQLKSGLSTTIMIRQFDNLMYLETSKDQSSTQGFSYTFGDSYFIQLFQAATVTVNQEPDLRVTEKKPIGMFDLSADGSKIAYLCDGNILLVEHILGKPQIVQRTTPPTEPEQQHPQKPQKIPSVSLIAAAIFTLITLLIIVAIHRLKKQNPPDSNPELFLQSKTDNPEPNTNLDITPRGNKNQDEIQMQEEGNSS